MAIIVAENLSKHFKIHKKDPGLKGSLKNLFIRKYEMNKAVDRISFSIEPGEMVGFLGPNGAGKTTTLKMLTGLIHPTEGVARVMDYTPWERRNEFRAQYALIMGQKNQLWMDLPAMESFLLNREIYGIPRRQFQETLDELVELLDVAKVLNVQARRLSLGERMKMEMIAALIHQPKVLFLDEPTIGLDIISQRKIRQFLLRYNREYGTTILLTSHYMEDIQALCKRVIIINHGRKVYDGGLAEIGNRFSDMKELTVVFAEPVLPEKVSGIAEIKTFDPVNITFRVKRDELIPVLSRLLAEYPVADITTSEMEIEEAISRIFREPAEELG